MSTLYVVGEFKGDVFTAIEILTRLSPPSRPLRHAISLIPSQSRYLMSQFKGLGWTEVILVFRFSDHATSLWLSLYSRNCNLLN